MKGLMVLICALGVLALSLGAVACGDDDDDEDTAATTTTEAASAEVVDVTGTEYSFELSATPTAETKEITFENAGEEPHDLIFAKINEGYTLQDAIEAEGRKGTAEQFQPILFAKPGEEAKQTIQLDEPLEPGNYAMVCTVSTKDGPPHFELGMTEEFTVE
jgi:plastocyanin